MVMFLKYILTPIEKNYRRQNRFSRINPKTKNRSFLDLLLVDYENNLQQCCLANYNKIRTTSEKSCDGMQLIKCYERNMA